MGDYYPGNERHMGSATDEDFKVASIALLSANNRLLEHTLVILKSIDDKLERISVCTCDCK